MSNGGLSTIDFRLSTFDFSTFDFVLVEHLVETIALVERRRAARHVSA